MICATSIAIDAVAEDSAKTDNQRFKSSLIDEQRNTQDKVSKLSTELTELRRQRAQLEKTIEQIQQDSSQCILDLQKKIDERNRASDELSKELVEVRALGQEKVQQLTEELKQARRETTQIKQQLIQARQGNTDQVTSLEQDLKNSHEKLQKLRADLIEAKSINSKQLKDFTAWLYNAKTEAEELKKELAIQQTTYKSQLEDLEKQLKIANDNSVQLHIALQESKQTHQDEMFEMKEQLLIAQNQVHQQQQIPQVVCCEEPMPPIFCYRANFEEPTSWVRGEVLVWTVETGDLDFVIPSSPVPGATGTGQIGRVEEAKFDWCPGFRFEIGHRFRPDFWEIGLGYTYIDIDGSETYNLSSSSSSIMQPTQNSTSVQETRLAKSEVDFLYNVFDLMLARSFLPAKQLMVRPRVGLTGAWMDRDFDIKYTGSGSPENKVHNRNEWEFHGGGMRVGVDVDWYFGSGFSLSGRTSVAALIGYYTNTYRSDTNNANTPNAPATVENAKYDDQRIATHIQMQLGPMWGKMWNDVGFSVFAGYELNAWFNVEEVRSGLTQDSSSVTSRRTLINDSTLGMQGFVGKLQVNF